jgi:hypothetical protein
MKKSPTPRIFEIPLEHEALRLKQAAFRLRPSKERDVLIKKARQLNVAAHLNEWLTSPGLQPPRR